MEPQSSDTRSSVLCRVKNPDDHDGWRRFFEIYGPFIKKQILCAGLPEDDAQEITQETLIEISNRIQSFDYDRSRGSFKAWLRRLIRWRIANHFQRKQRSFISIENLPAGLENGRNGESAIPAADDWDQSWEKDWRQTLFRAALNNLRQTISPRHFQVFDCLVVKEWTISQVAAAMNMNRAQIYLIKLRVASTIRKEIERLEKHGF
jgi:RNA polymerase sigma-70 factor (ECF subfamily)